jgi:hypothetical protein
MSGSNQGSKAAEEKAALEWGLAEYLKAQKEKKLREAIIAEMDKKAKKLKESLKKPKLENKISQ